VRAVNNTIIIASGYLLTVRRRGLFNGLTANDRWHRIYRSQWVSSFLTAHQHIIGYSVP